MDRRSFIQRGTAATVGVSLAGARAVAKNDEIGVAIVGINGQGRSHLQCFAAIPGVRVRTICDVDERLFPEVRKTCEDLTGSQPRCEIDLRKVLEDKEVDVVSIATPEHWHALQSIWACQAGKDVYVEKPVTHNISEGRKLVEAARKYGRIVAPGTQYRSSPHVREAVRLLREGVIGDVYMARGLCFKPRESIGRKADSPTPQGVHYDLWLGPAPLRPFNENRFHYNWHWFWDYGCADIGNQGVHEIDIARWGLGKGSLPTKVHSVGGYFAFDSDQETPNTQSAVFEWDDGKLLQFEVRGLFSNAENEMLIGNLFYGAKGWMHVDQKGFRTYLGRKNEPGPSGEPAERRQLQATGVPKGFEESGVIATARRLHRENFIAAVRSREAGDLSAGILEGHVSSSLCHLANLSYRLQRALRFDPEAERFVGDEEANRLLTRRYRPPFVMPEKV